MGHSDRRIAHFAPLSTVQYNSAFASVRVRVRVRAWHS